MLFFSPWVLEWPITMPGLDCNEVKLRLADGLALLSVAAYALAGWPGRERLRQSQLKVFGLALAALVVFAASSMLWAASRGTALAFTIRLAWWIAIAIRVACDDVPPRHIAVALLSGLFLQAVVGIAQFAAQRQLGLSVFGELPIELAYPGVSVISAGNATLIRLYGLSGHPNVIGGYAAIALLVGTGLLREQHAQWWAMWLVGLIGLLLTFSRSAALGLLIGLAAIAAAWRPGRGALRLIASGGIVIAIFAAVFAPMILARLSGQGAMEQASIDERLAQSALAWNLFAGRPLTGVGFGNFTLYNAPTPPTDHIMRVHNVPLLIASELGLPGLLLWLIGVSAVIVAGVRSGRDKAASLWPTLALSALIAILVISMFDHYWWTSSQGVYVWAALSGRVLSGSGGDFQNPIG